MSYTPIDFKIRPIVGLANWLPVCKDLNSDTRPVEVLPLNLNQLRGNAGEVKEVETHVRNRVQRVCVDDNRGWAGLLEKQRRRRVRLFTK